MSVKIPDATKKTVNEKLNELRELLKKEDASAEELAKKTEETALSAQEIGKIIYEAAAKAETEKKGDDKKDGAVDAEVVDEKDKKKG